MPPKEEYFQYLEEIWDRNWLTNNGPLVQDLESKLAKYLDVDSAVLVTNGTIGLQIAVKALEVEGDVITTPFSYVATTSSLVWENCKPVFVDIDPQSLNIDASKIEEKIGPQTSAILATHVYGNPCQLEAIQEIAAKNDLAVIYDAAHSFGVNYNGRSIFSYGDFSVCSFHATKIFHTIEGGGLFTPKVHLKEKAAFMRNFGHDGPERFNGVGINGKNSEFHAAMGLINLRHLERIVERRKQICDLYDQLLQASKVSFPEWNPQATRNYAYYPVIFESRSRCLKVFDDLGQNKIQARRYFHPTLNNLTYLKNHFSTPIAEEISERILCLPLFEQLTNAEVEMICEEVIKSLES